MNDILPVFKTKIFVTRFRYIIVFFVVFLS